MGFFRTGVTWGGRIPIAARTSILTLSRIRLFNFFLGHQHEVNTSA